MTVTLAITQNETTKTFDLDGPGGQIRFGVGSPGTALSGVWTVFSNPTSSDVYVASRSLGGHQKVSLHEGDDWRLQWTNREVAAKYAPGKPRQIYGWKRPAANAVGWIRALQIAVPATDLVALPYPENERKPIRWVPQPAPEFGVLFQIVIAKPDLGMVNSRGAIPIDAYSLTNGEVCIVLARVLRLTPEVEGELEEHRRLIDQLTATQQIEVSPSIRIASYASEIDGTQTIWDLAAFRDQVSKMETSKASR